VEHPTRWERVAVVTDVGWIVQMMRNIQLPHALPGEVVFRLRRNAQAHAWIIAAS